MKCASVPCAICAALALGGILIGGGWPSLSAAQQIVVTMPVAPAAPPSASPPGLPPPPPPVGIPPDELPRFEVASVKKFEGRVTSTALRTPGGGRITIVNLPLRTIIMQAWGIRDYQLSGGPSWLTSDRFTINAKAEGNVPRDQILLMVRALLVDRFQLRYRVEPREMQAYVLTTAKPEWTPTARMRPVDCAPPGAAARPPAAPLRADQMPCGGMMLSTAGIQGRGVTMATFTSLLSSIGGLGVVHDRTGLTGTYHIELDASPTALLRSAALLSSVNPSSDSLLPEIGDGRSLGSAVRDLGLSLDRRREAVDVLVIEDVSQPDED